jgi:hypothetical protein
MSVGLRDSKGRDLILDPEFSIRWEIEDDYMDFDRVGQAFSWTILIPIKGNEKTFLYASDAATSKNKFKTYDGFAVTVAGNLWWNCSFDLIDVSEDQLYYEGILSTIPSSIFDNKDKLIKEIIIAEIDQPSGTNPEILAAYNNDVNGDVFFPLLNFYGSKLFPKNLINDSEDILPAFRIFYLLRVAFEALGYSLSLYIPKSSDLHKLVIVSNKLTTIGIFGPSKLIVNEFCPQLTLSQLMNNCAKISGCGIYVNINDKNVSLSPAFDQRYVGNEIDLRSILSADLRPGKSAYNDLKVTYPLSNDSILSDNPESLIGEYLGVFDSRSDFNISTSADENSYGFCKLENYYVQWVQGKSALQLRIMAYPFMEYKSGENNPINFHLDVIPTTKSRYTTVFETGTYQITDNGSGKVRINGNFAFFSIANLSNYKLGFNERTTEYKPGESTYTIDTADSDFMDISLTFTGEAVVDRVFIKYDLGHYIPIIGEKPHQPKYDLFNEAFTPRIMIYHGIVQNIANDSSYAYASADNYYSDDGDSVEVGNLSLNLNIGDYNIGNLIFDKIVQYLKEIRVLKGDTYLNATEILRLFDKVKFARHNKGVMRVRKITTILSKNGTGKQEIEGYRL